MKSSAEIAAPAARSAEPSARGGAGPRANSYNFVPLLDVARARGAPCPFARLSSVPYRRERHVLFRLRDRLRVFATTTTDFDDRELLATKHELGQLYLDVSTKLAPDDFARDLKKLVLSAECASCDTLSICPAAWEPIADDLFTRDDARVREILASLEGRVLDVGGGEASYLAPLADRARRGQLEYTSVDPDEARLALLAARYPFARFRAGFAEDLDASLGRFDHVLFLRSVNHLADPARAIDRAAALLRPGGTLLLVDNVAFGLVRSRAHAARAEAAPTNQLEHHRNDGAAEVAALVASLGRPLTLVERRDIDAHTSNQWLLRYRAGGEGSA